MYVATPAPASAIVVLAFQFLGCDHHPPGVGVRWCERATLHDAAKVPTDLKDSRHAGESRILPLRLVVLMMGA